MTFYEKVRFLTASNIVDQPLKVDGGRNEIKLMWPYQFKSVELVYSTP